MPLGITCTGGLDMATRVSAADRAESIATLRGILAPGDTVTTVLRSVSRSGMSRSIDLYTFACEDGAVSKRWLSYHVARVLGGWDDRRECVKVSGAGMDMGFHLVMQLGYVLWPDGFDCTGDRCPSSDHSNGDRDRTPHRHASGGYALRQEWLG